MHNKVAMIKPYSLPLEVAIRGWGIISIWFVGEVDEIK